MRALSIVRCSIIVFVLLCTLCPASVPKNTFSSIFFEWIAYFLWAKEEWAILSKKERVAHSLFYHEQPERIAPSRSWATWAICSPSLICPERSERIAHSCSFVLSNLSEWANGRWANSQPWNFVQNWRELEPFIRATDTAPPFLVRTSGAVALKKMVQVPAIAAMEI